jgi:hypothetical protein
LVTIPPNPALLVPSRRTLFFFIDIPLTFFTLV